MAANPAPPPEPGAPALEAAAAAPAPPKPAAAAPEAPSGAEVALTAQAQLAHDALRGAAAEGGAEEQGVWGPGGAPEPSGRRELFQVGGLSSAPSYGHALRWSADNRVAAICGGTIYVQTLGTSRTAAGGSGMTYVQERAAILGLDKDPAFKGDIPEPSGDASSGRKFQLAPVLVAKMKDNLVSGRFVTGKPRFRAMAWSPALPADDECLIATCSSDHHVAICAPPTGYGKTWTQIACLSDLLLKQLKKVGHDPRRIASLSDSAAAASPPMPDACLRKLGLASTFTVAWSQRTSRSDGKLTSWIAMGGAQSLSIFTHTTASTRSFSTGGTAAQSSSFPASHSFNCSELVALPAEAAHVTALAWLDEGPSSPTAGAAAAACPLLVTGTGSGSVWLWNASTDASEKPECTLTPLQAICAADNSPVLSLLPAPWLTPAGTHDSPRLAIAKGTGVWIWEHGSDPWEGRPSSSSDAPAKARDKKRAKPAGAAAGHKRSRGTGGGGAKVPGRQSVGRTYLLPKVGPSMVSGAAWSRDCSAKGADGDGTGAERLLLFVSNLECVLCGYEGAWSSSEPARLTPSAPFDEQSVGSCIWGLAASPNALVLATLVESKASSKNAAHVSFGLRPFLEPGTVRASVQTQLASAGSADGTGCPSPLGPGDVWTLAEYAIATATEPHLLLPGTDQRLRSALERCVYERRLSAERKSGETQLRGSSAKDPALFAGHRAAGPLPPMFSQHELKMRRQHVLGVLRAVAAGGEESARSLSPTVRQAAWRMVAWAEHDAAGTSDALSEEAQEAALAANVGDVLRASTPSGEKTKHRQSKHKGRGEAGAELGGEQPEEAVEACPLCKGALTASGLAFASCGSGHRWSRCCYSLALLSLQGTEGRWLRSSVWPQCTAMAEVAWELCDVLRQPAPLCPVTGMRLLPARGTM